MQSINSINTNNNIYIGRTGSISASAEAAISNPVTVKKTFSFGNIPAFSSASVRTSLTTADEKQKYNTIVSMLDRKTKKNLNAILKEGKLLNNNSDDKSTVLDNLYKIATIERAPGLNQADRLKDVIDRIASPFIIIQKFGDIPKEKMTEVLSTTPVNNGTTINEASLDVHSSTCPAASIEFNLAHKMPAEFARIAEGLTSDKLGVTKTINVDNLSQSLVDTIWMLHEFKLPHKFLNWNTLKVDLQPDRNAIIRARIQNTYKDKGERSVVDVLMQSTFMNIGAQNTYDSLIDKRIPKYNDDDSGLIDIEKNFAEEIATGKGKVCVTYQKMDENGKLVGYECEPQETLKHIRDTLNMGDNVIIGYTYCDNDNNVIGGHEITIIGIEKGKNGKEYFICNDTDDGIDAPIKYPVDEWLPKIHHAGIPKAALKENVEFVENWKELMNVYIENKKAQQAAFAAA